MRDATHALSAQMCQRRRKPAGSRGRARLNILVAWLLLLGCGPLVQAAASEPSIAPIAARAEPAFLAQSNQSNPAAQIMGRTLLHYSAQHGTQVEYYGADGRSYLWYPGNTGVVATPYQVDTASGDICFDFSGQAVDPSQGGTPIYDRCFSNADFHRNVRESVPGDIFNLSAGAGVPFVIGPELTSIAALRSRWGR